MGTPSVFSFLSFHFDSSQKLLTRRKQKLRLSGKALDILLYLLRHPNEVVKKRDLLTAVWGSPDFDPENLRAYIRIIRRALGDKAKSPRFIESVYGDGYRFIAPITIISSSSLARERVQSPKSKVQRHVVHPLDPRRQTIDVPCVGRDTELAHLQSLLEKAQTGQRQAVFVNGEPGIGKSTLLKSFVPQLADSPNILVALGQCTEHYGVGELYQPVIEAVERLCHQPQRHALISQLRQYAPLWLAQMPPLLNAKQHAALQRETQGVSRERMQREFANFIEAFTTDSIDSHAPVLVLYLEDLHWSDPSTLDLFVTLARRPEPARLLLIATYRPIDVLSNNHPLRTMQAELQARHQCTELRLSGFDETTIETYLSQRFAVEEQNRASVQRLARALYRRTEGNPFSVVTLVDDLVAQRVIAYNDGRWMLPNECAVVKAGVPTKLQQFIEFYLDRLAPEDQQILLAASVTVGDFSPDLIASALHTDRVEEIDQRCTALARRQQFLQPVGNKFRPNKRKFDRFTFRHALSRKVCFERLTTWQQRQLHQRIGTWKEKAYGPRAQALAAELALHFDRGHDPQRALHYYQQTTENAVHRYVSQEA